MSWSGCERLKKIEIINRGKAVQLEEFEEIFDTVDRLEGHGLSPPLPVHGLRWIFIWRGSR